MRSQSKSPRPPSFSSLARNAGFPIGLTASASGMHVVDNKPGEFSLLTTHFSLPISVDQRPSALELYSQMEKARVLVCSQALK